MGNAVIYRPAYDAEVEYLESDGNSYIDTGLKASSELGILAHIQNYGDGHGWMFGGGNAEREKTFAFLPHGNSDESSLRYSTQNVSILSPLDKDVVYEFNNIDNHYILYVNSLTYTASNATFESDNNFYLFAANTGSSVGKSSGIRIYDFKIYQNSTLVRDFIPVRIGNVGYMYDKVTKQLFANKGTGNFILGNDVSNAVIPQQRCVLYFGNQRSVGFERIYEEYEWLVGDGSAYIDTGIIYPAERFNIRTYLINNNDNYNPSVGGSFAQIAFTNRDGSATNSYIHINPRKDRKLYYCDFQISREFVPWIEGIPTTIDVSMNHVNTNASSLQLFYSDRIWTNIPWDGSIGELVIQSQSSSVGSHFIPCKLLVSIPAFLDGNGIARQAGECGMWDKVSNRFYGNVASSGTFTVKGPKCYEEYKWLVGDGSAYITHEDVDAFEVKVLQLNNTRTFYAFGYYKNNSNLTPRLSLGKATTGSNYSGLILRRNSDGAYLANYKTPSLNIGEHIITKNTQTDQIGVFTDGVRHIKNSVSTDIDYVGTDIIFNQLIPSQNLYIGYLSSPNIHNLVPCKLTHSIPASMDANGIARPAGTCGMWDKVNDKFYGNVNSSGSFTVSND